jgi:hypothetical protein
MKARSFSCVSLFVSVSLAALAGCTDDLSNLNEWADDIDDGIEQASCQLSQSFAGYTEVVPTTGGNLAAKGPGATLVARGATETLVWNLPQPLNSDADVALESEQGSLAPGELVASCGTDLEGESNGEEPAQTFSFDLTFEALALGSDSLRIVAEGSALDAVAFEVREAAALALESTPEEPSPDAEPGAERFSTVCATLSDVDGEALYAADSIAWRLVAGEATLITGVFGVDPEAPATGRCITVSSKSSEPVVVEASFLELAQEVEVELP